MKAKKFIAEYCNFSRKEIVGFVTIAIVSIALLYLPYAYKSFFSKKNEPITSDTGWISQLRLLETENAAKDYTRRDNGNSNDHFTGSYRDYKEYSPQGELFAFDPNNTSFQDWLRLGLKEKTIHTIENYLSKGGHFYKPEDLKKIYGLRPNEYEKLAPFIHLPTGETKKNNSLTANEPPRVEKPARSRLQPFDINLADTSQLIALPGIGSKLASRILNFRDKLGGFVRLEQIGEVYGLPDSVFQKIKPFFLLTPNGIKRVNINSATVDELKNHPYIKWDIARAIVNYRSAHGNYTSVEDLKKLMQITAEQFEKIKPYLTL